MTEQSIKKFFIGLAFVSSLNLYADTTVPTTSKNYFQPRAFSANMAREMLMQGSTDKQIDAWYADFSVTAAYQRSWNQNFDAISNTAATTNGLGVFPFWSGSNLMLVGSAQNFGVSFDVDSYQFGLGFVTANGGITLNPVVFQTGADFMLVFGSSQTQSGFFAKFKAPLGLYNINPNLTEVLPVLPETGLYPAGALSSSVSGTPLPATSMTQAFRGNLSNGQYHQGDFLPMQFGLIDGQVSTGVRFADIEMTAGYNLVFEKGSLSLAVRAAAPTGNKATAQYMLEPIFGRGDYWGLGGYLAGRAHIWEGENDNFVMIKFMSNVMHLFSTDTIRSFDLTANGVGSKYLLVADYSGDAYQGTIQNLINLSTLACKSSYDVEGDAALAFTYVHHGATFDIGYEFFGRSAETLEINGTLAEQAFAVLGNQPVYYFPSDIISDYNACQPLAAMNIPSAAVTGTPPSPDDQVTAQDSVVNATVGANRISGNDALNVAATEQIAYLTSKVYTQISYQWTENQYVPHLGVMGEFEISNSNNNALPQWSVALVGGLQF